MKPPITEMDRFTFRYTLKVINNKMNLTQGTGFQGTIVLLISNDIHIKHIFGQIVKI